jgi:hypothetical protein
MNVQDLKDYVVIPTLRDISNFIPFTQSAANLVLGTGAQESNFQYLDQTTPGPGPACGIYQMERATHADHTAWLKQKPDFWKLVQEYEIVHLDNWAEMHGNLYYATIMCRIHYWRAPGNLPAANDIEGMAKYWKQYYNTYLGAGKVEEFVANYNRFVVNLK